MKRRVIPIEMLEAPDIYAPAAIRPFGQFGTIPIYPLSRGSVVPGPLRSPRSAISPPWALRESSGRGSRLAAPARRLAVASSEPSRPNLGSTRSRAGWRCFRIIPEQLAEAVGVPALAQGRQEKRRMPGVPTRLQVDRCYRRDDDHVWFPTAAPIPQSLPGRRPDKAGFGPAGGPNKEKGHPQ